MSWACGIQWLFECWYNLYSCPSKTWGTVSLTTYASFTLFNVLLVSPLICHAHPAYLNPPDFETWILSGTVKDHVESWDEQASEDAGKLTVKVVNFGQNGGVRFRLTWCRISWREEIVSWSLSAWDKPIAMMPLSCRPASCDISTKTELGFWEHFWGSIQWAKFKTELTTYQETGGHVSKGGGRGRETERVGLLLFAWVHMGRRTRVWARPTGKGRSDATLAWAIKVTL